MSPGKFKGYLAGYLPVNLVQALAALGVVMIYTRLLEPAEYGRYALAITALQWLQVLLFFWLHSGVARFYEASRLQQQLPGLLTVSAVAGLLISGMWMVLAGAVAIRLEDAWRGLVLAGLVGLIARSLSLLGLEAHRAAHRVQRYTVLESGQILFGLALGALWVSLAGGGAAAILWAAALASLLAVLFDTPFWLRLMRPFTWSTDALRRLAGYGLPLTASALLSQVIVSSDRFFIAWLIDERAVGVYSVAYALADRPAAIVYNWIGMAAVPLAFAAMERDGPLAARQVMEKTAKAMMLLVFPCTVGLAAVAEPLAVTLTGADFREETARLIPWIAVASLLYGGMVHYAAHAFLITQNPRGLLATNILIAILNLALNLLLIPFFGLAGAVAASLIAYAVGFGLRLALARRFFAVPLPGAEALRVALACAGMALALKAAALPATPTGLLLSIGLGVVAYGGGLLLFNVADSQAWLIARWRTWRRGEPADHG